MAKFYGLKDNLKEFVRLWENFRPEFCDEDDFEEEFESFYKWMNDMSFLRPPPDDKLLPLSKEEYFKKMNEIICQNESINAATTSIANDAIEPPMEKDDE
jgi:hypothetical protein